jgi:hypothetical protein
MEVIGRLLVQQVSLPVDCKSMYSKFGIQALKRYSCVRGLYF